MAKKFCESAGAAPTFRSNWYTGGNQRAKFPTRTACSAEELSAADDIIRAKREARTKS